VSEAPAPAVPLTEAAPVAPRPAAPAPPPRVAVTAAESRHFDDLTYEGFRELAMAEGLSPYQRIGFPDSYRSGHEEAIFRDLRAKLRRLDGEAGVVLDIGPGCSQLPRMLIDLCRRRGHRLILCDSPEMLGLLPDGPDVLKVAGRYPDQAATVFADYAGRVDVILSYSVLQYVFAEQPVFDFIDRTLSLLAPGGACLLGDVPNVSMRKRFFRSDAGVRCHQEFTRGPGLPEVKFNCPEPGKLDDAVVLGVLARCRAAGFHAFVVPQAPELPMATRREDILIHRP
jgi:hypothetical protein